MVKLIKLFLGTINESLSVGVVGIGYLIRLGGGVLTVRACLGELGIPAGMPHMGCARQGTRLP